MFGGGHRLISWPSVIYVLFKTFGILIIAAASSSIPHFSRRCKPYKLFNLWKPVTGATALRADYERAFINYELRIVDYAFG